MSQWYGRIYVGVSEKKDWEKLFDMDLKPEWALGYQKGKEVFGECNSNFYYIDDEWGITADNLEEFVDEIVKRIGSENCVILADSIDINVDPLHYIFAVVKEKYCKHKWGRKKADIKDIYSWLDWGGIKRNSEIEKQLSKIFPDYSCQTNNKEAVNKKIVVSGDAMGDIEGRAYYNRLDITEAELSDEIISIGDEAFKGCKNLEKMNFPGIEESFDENGNPEYWQYEYPNGFLLLGKNILEGTKIEEKYFNKEEGTFYYMGCLLKATGEEVVVREDTLEIAFGAFQGVKKLTIPRFGQWHAKSIDILSWIDEESYGCLEEIVIKEGVKDIEVLCIEEMINLKKVVIPESVNDIPEYAIEFMRNRNITFVVPKGSYAEKFVKDNELNYEAVASLE